MARGKVGAISSGGGGREGTRLYITSSLSAPLYYNKLARDRQGSLISATPSLFPGSLTSKPSSVGGHQCGCPLQDTVLASPVPLAFIREMGFHL